MANALCCKWLELSIFAKKGGQKVDRWSRGRVERRELGGVRALPDAVRPGLRDALLLQEHP